MQEELITFETAKLAKEKGFNVRCDGRYYWDYMWKHSKAGVTKCDNSGESVATPTQALLQRWLREIHKLDITIRPNGLEKYDYHILYDSNYYSSYRMSDSYEEALEQGLQEALKLIK